MDMSASAETAPRPLTLPNSSMVKSAKMGVTHDQIPQHFLRNIQMILPRCLFSLLLALAPLGAHAYPWTVSVPTQGSVSQVLSPDGKQIAMAATFGPVVIFSAENGQVLAAQPRPTERSYSLAWKADGSGFYYGNPDGVRGMNMVAFGGKGKEKKLLGGTHQITASPAGRWIASIDYDTLGILNLRSERAETWMQEDSHQGRKLPIMNVRRLAWQDEDTLLAIQGGWGVGVPFAVTRYDLAHHKILARIELPEGSVTEAWALDKARHLLWIGTDKGHLLQVDIEKQQVIADQELASAAISALALSLEGHLAAWVDDHILLLDAQAPTALPRSIPAWRTDSSNGWNPLLVWDKGDLLMASKARQSSQWLAERRARVMDAVE
jgi:hypothetical protein